MIAWTGGVTVLFFIVALVRVCVLHPLDKAKRQRGLQRPAAGDVGAAAAPVVGVVGAASPTSYYGSPGSPQYATGGMPLTTPLAAPPAMATAAGAVIELAELIVIQPVGSVLSPEFSLTTSRRTTGPGATTDYRLQIPVRYGQSATLLISGKPIFKGRATPVPTSADIAVRIGPECSTWETVPLNTVSGSFSIPLTGEQLPFDLELLVKQTGADSPITIYRVGVSGLTTTLMEPLIMR